MTEARLAIPTRTCRWREDTRLLGRLLGDVLRAQAGEAGYARIEAIRRTAIRFRRADRDEAEAGGLRPSSRGARRPVAPGRSTSCARSATSRTSQHRRGPPPEPPAPRARAGGSAPQRGTLADALACIEAAGRRAAPSLRSGSTTRVVSPVLTAHPTEVQRKSILDCEREVARAPPRARPRGLTPDEAGESRPRCHRQILRPVADGDAPPAKLDVDRRDRQRPRLLPATRSSPGPAPLPALEADWRASRRDAAAAAAFPAPRLLDRRRSRRQSVRHRRRCSTTRQRAGRASCSRTISPSCTCSAGALAVDALVEPTPELLRSPRPPATRRRTARRALPARAGGIYARLAATARALAGLTPPRAPHAPPAALCERRRASRRPRRVDASLRRARRGAARRRPAAPAAPRRRRASASISRRSTCARTPTCTSASSAELLARRRRRRRLRGARRDRARRAARARARAPAAARIAARRLPRARRAAELAILRAAADDPPALGADALPNYIISKCESVSDLLEVACC